MNRLKELRREKTLSQRELALELQVPIRTYQRWENGESQIKSEKAQVLADYFGVSVAYLLGHSDYSGDNLRDLLVHEIKSLKEWKMLRVRNENYISENQVLDVIDKYIK